MRSGKLRARLLVAVAVITVFVAGKASVYGLSEGSHSGHEAAAQPVSPAPLGAEQITVGQGELPQAADDVVPGELIVQFDQDISLATEDSALAGDGVVVKRHLLLPGFVLVGVPVGQEEQFLSRLQANPLVRMAERNGIDRAAFTPNDPLYPRQWDMPQVQSEQAWDLANGTGVVVAVVDSGVAYENYSVYAQAPDLAGTSFTAGYDFINSDAHPNDDVGHGTHVTGTIAQTTNNSLGVAGLAFGATIMPVKTLSPSGGTHAQMADGYVWATDHGADVINYSAGGDDSTTKRTAVDYALSHGVVVVAAAGNDGTSTLECPACYPGVIAVGATDYNMNLSWYSTYGCGLEGHCLDVVAPGGDTTVYHGGYPDGVYQQTYDFACNGGATDFTHFAYCFWQGTSMATPHVAAAAALLLDANPSLTVQQVGDCLRNTALDRGAPGYDTTYGYGLIQARAALDACSGATPPNRFFGDVTLNGLPAPPGTNVTATIGGNACGQTTVQANSTYVLDVVSSGQTLGCGTEGATVSFSVAGLAAGTGTWHSNSFTRLDLCATSGPDADSDCIPDSVDNCPLVYNPGQENTDAAIDNGPGIPGNDTTIPNAVTDNVGDACDTDPDIDHDGLPNSQDTNPLGATGICAAFAGASDGHPNPAGGDVTNDDDHDGNPAFPMGSDASDNGPSWDTDNDGFLDGYECLHGSNPRDVNSRPAALVDDNADNDGDGLRNGWERRGWGTDPNVVDSDGDGLGDCVEAADVNGNGVVDFVEDTLFYARATLLPRASFGKTMDFDLDKNGVADFGGDLLQEARFAFKISPCQ
jgi:serine protease